MICTLSPCLNCARSLWQAGVHTVYFKEMYSKHTPSMVYKDLILECTTIIEGGETFWKMDIKANITGETDEVHK